MRVELVNGSPQLQVNSGYTGPYSSKRAPDIAERLLAEWLTLPAGYQKKLGGPCPKCERWFVSFRKEGQQYCSSECGRNKSASSYLTKLRQIKLKHAEATIEQWRKKHQTDWGEQKIRIAEEANKALQADEMIAPSWKQAIEPINPYFLTYNFNEDGTRKEREKKIRLSKEGK